MSNHQEALVIGAGGHATVVVGTLQAAGYGVKGLLDDDRVKWGTTVLGVPVLGATADFERFPFTPAVIAIGNNAIRRAMALKWKLRGWLTVVHPDASVHGSVRLGPGTVVFAGAVIQPHAEVGSHCILNTSSSVDHDCVLEDYTHIAPGVRLGGDVHLGEGVFLGIGCSAIPGVKVGNWSSVGAGGVITKDLESGVLAVGVPARPIRKGFQHE